MHYIWYWFHTCIPFISLIFFSKLQFATKLHDTSIPFSDAHYWCVTFIRFIIEKKTTTTIKLTKASNEMNGRMIKTLLKHIAFRDQFNFWIINPLKFNANGGIMDNTSPGGYYFIIIATTETGQDTGLS